MTEGKTIIHIRGPPLQKTDIQNKKDPLGIEITLIIAGQTMSIQEEDVLMMVAWSHEVETEKNAEKEMWIGKGPGNLHLLGEEAQNHRSPKVPLLRMNLIQRRRKRSWILSLLALVEHIFLLQSSG